MRNAVTTGISEIQNVDSDSVNLGSNPSPPATQIIEKKALSCPGHFRPDGLSRSFGRTEPGTLDQGVVYFITDGDAIKIGFSQVPKLRLTALQTSHHKPLRVIGTVPAMLHDEGTIHRWFSHLRLRGEWFRPDQDLTTFIEQVCREPDKATRPRPPALPSSKEIHRLLAAVEAKAGADQRIASLIRIGRGQMRTRASGITYPELEDAIRATLQELRAALASMVSAREERA